MCVGECVCVFEVWIECVRVFAASMMATVWPETWISQNFDRVEEAELHYGEAKGYFYCSRVAFHCSRALMDLSFMPLSQMFLLKLFWQNTSCVQMGLRYRMRMAQTRSFDSEKKKKQKKKTIVKLNGVNNCIVLFSLMFPRCT